MRTPRERRCILLRGTRESTSTTANALVARLSDVLRVGAGVGGVAPREVRSLLGQAFDAVIIDVHGGIDADTLGQVHGLIRGGGALILCAPDDDGAVARLPSLAIAPFTVDDVGNRFWTRVARKIEASPALDTSLTALPPTPPPAQGSDEQRAVVDELARVFVGDTARIVTLTADRGRGKSSALGLALARALRDRPGLRVSVSAPSPEAAREIFRFAGGALTFVEPAALLARELGADVIVVDEAAQLPVPLLQRLVSRHPQARVALATTTHGYEGTGRGFALRFVPWLAAYARDHGRELLSFVLHEPIRWPSGDPLEQLMMDALVLDAEPAALDYVFDAVATDISRAQARRVTSDELARDERLLRGVFALLVHAHYRTAPSDLQRMLDAPNIDVHAVVVDGAVLGATLIAREGRLSPAECERYARGEERVRGQALADTLMTHAGRADAGALDIVRSVRIATHPELRRRGLARMLVDHVHSTYASEPPDLFGTMFGATAELVSFRRSVGYDVVRLGGSRGARTGEPSAIMLRAGSDQGAALIADLRSELARDIALQLELLANDDALGAESALADALTEGLPPAAALPELSDGELRARMRSYLAGPRTFESVVHAIVRFVEAHRHALAQLDRREQALIDARVLRRAHWRAAAAAAGYESVPSAMRALRPALQKLFDIVEARERRR